MSKITCPFCFNVFDVEDMHFRCIHRDCPGKTEPDEIFVREHGRLPPLSGHVIQVGKGTKVKRNGSFGRGAIESVQCDHDKCRRETRFRLCPKCHYELKHDIDTVTQKIIAVIGGSNAGKSHYLGSLVTRLQHDIGPLFDFAIIRWNDETRDRWERDFRKPLFTDHEILKPTQRAAGNYTVQTPLVFRLTFKKGNRFEALNFSFFDTAGEDMTETNLEQLNSSEARYISKADGLIVLLDPLQIENVRQELSWPEAGLPQFNPRAHPEHVIERLWDLLERSGRQLAGANQIQFPVAFTFSKIDTLRSIVEADSAFLHSSTHHGTFNLADMQSVHSEISARLEGWLPGFQTAVEAKFANYRFFGVSALGSQPVPNSDPGKPDRITPSPLRVEDPFLWILSLFGLVPSSKKG